MSQVITDKDFEDFIPALFKRLKQGYSVIYYNTHLKRLVVSRVTCLAEEAKKLMQNDPEMVTPIFSRSSKEVDVVEGVYALTKCVNKRYWGEK